MTFTVTMPTPSSHTFHVELRSEGLRGELQDFKLPQWSPGYYVIEDYSRYVSHFRAEDGAGHELAWEKVTRNTWRIVSAGAAVVVLNYDVYGDTVFAANNYLGEDRAYILPSAMFVHLADRLREPVTVRVELPANWKRIATGLEPAPGHPPGRYEAGFRCALRLPHPDRQSGALPV